jgi:Dimethyladenosine transferase (rRNA methylation)
MCGAANRPRLNPAAEPLRDVIARHRLSAKKTLGQNFILDRQLLRRIAAIPGPLKDERVYEVGPGPGGLTRSLLEAGAKSLQSNGTGAAFRRSSSFSRNLALVSRLSKPMR